MTKIHPYSLLTDFIATGFHLSSIINACISSSAIPYTVPYSPLTLVVRYYTTFTHAQLPSSCDLVTLFKQPLHPAQSYARIHAHIPHILMPRGAPVTLHNSHTHRRQPNANHEIATSAVFSSFFFFIHSTHNPARGADGARVAGVRWPSMMHEGGEGVARNSRIS